MEMNFSRCCSEQIDVPESIGVIINLTPPIVSWNMIVSVVAVSWGRHGLTIILPWRELMERSTHGSTGMRYCSNTLFH